MRFHRNRFRLRGSNAGARATRDASREERCRAEYSRPLALCNAERDPRTPLPRQDRAILVDPGNDRPGDPEIAAVVHSPPATRSCVTSAEASGAAATAAGAF